MADEGKHFGGYAHSPWHHLFRSHAFCNPEKSERKNSSGCLGILYIRSCAACCQQNRGFLPLTHQPGICNSRATCVFGDDGKSGVRIHGFCWIDVAYVNFLSWWNTFLLPAVQIQNCSACSVALGTHHSFSYADRNSVCDIWL